MPAWEYCRRIGILYANALLPGQLGLPGGPVKHSQISNRARSEHALTQPCDPSDDHILKNSIL